MIPKIFDGMTQEQAECALVDMVQSADTLAGLTVCAKLVRAVRNGRAATSIDFGRLVARRAWQILAEEGA